MKEIKKVFFYQSLVGLSHFLALSFLNVRVMNMLRGVKNYSDYSPNPFIILPLLAGAYGGFLIIKKAFRLAKQFENAE